MFKPKNTSERIRHRLKIAKGHLDKVIKMVEEKDYCIDILHQSQAVQEAIKQTDYLIMEDHLNSCASEKIKTGKGDEAIAELMEVFRKGR